MRSERLQVPPPQRRPRTINNTPQRSTMPAPVTKENLFICLSPALTEAGAARHKSPPEYTNRTLMVLPTPATRAVMLFPPKTKAVCLFLHCLSKTEKKRHEGSQQQNHKTQTLEGQSSRPLESGGTHRKRKQGRRWWWWWLGERERREGLFLPLSVCVPAATETGRCGV